MRSASSTMAIGFVHRAEVKIKLQGGLTTTRYRSAGTRRRSEPRSRRPVLVNGWGVPHFFMLVDTDNDAAPRDSSFGGRAGRESAS
jgi:hypothetical protein